MEQESLSQARILNTIKTVSGESVFQVHIQLKFKRVGPNEEVYARGTNSELESLGDRLEHCPKSSNF